jgi:hypothetical protein
VAPRATQLDPLEAWLTVRSARRPRNGLAVGPRCSSRASTRTAA